MSHTARIVVATTLSLSTLFACSKRPDPAPEPVPTAAEAPAEDPAALETAIAKNEAKKLFTTRCAVCHGEQGKGNGPGSAALDPKPRDYTSGTWQKSVTDDQLRAVITMGGAAIGKSPIMPSSPDLQSKPKVVDALVSIVRSFGTT